MKKPRESQVSDMCIFRSEFSAVDNTETFGRNVSFNDTFISTFQKLKSQKDLNSLVVHGACVSKVEEETGVLKKTLVSSSVEGRRKFSWFWQISC